MATLPNGLPPTCLVYGNGRFLVAVACPHVDIERLDQELRVTERDGIWYARCRACFGLDRC